MHDNLSQFDLQLFGKRSPPEMNKIRFLGKGGAAAVWLCSNEKGYFAVKQFPIKGSQSWKNEIEVQALIKGRENHPGKKNVAILIETLKSKKDIWLVYELGGKSLSSSLFEVKGEFYKGERIYAVNYQPLYRILKKDQSLLK